MEEKKNVIHIEFWREQGGLALEVRGEVSCPTKDLLIALYNTAKDSLPNEQDQKALGAMLLLGVNPFGVVERETKIDMSALKKAAEARNNGDS